MEINGTFTKIIEWVWVPILILVGHIYVRLSGMSASVSRDIAVLKQTNTHQEGQRDEDVVRNNADHQEIKERLEDHNKRVLAELKEIKDRLEK